MELAPSRDARFIPLLFVLKSPARDGLTVFGRIEEGPRVKRGQPHKATSGEPGQQMHLAPETLVVRVV